jgi:colanic acid/amylovoran biosynthesis glycosyltransferase
VTPIIPRDSQTRDEVPVEQPTVCVIVNKDAGKLGPSETFLKAHINRLGVETLPLIGNPGYRRRGDGEGPYLLSQSLVGRGWRWAKRQTPFQTPHSQDTAALARFLEAQRVDAVLAEYGPTAASVADACESAGVPLIAHFHGWDAYVLPRDETILRSYRRMFEVATAIVGSSHHMVRQLVSLGAPERKVVWNVYGVEVPDESAAPGVVGPRFVAVGRLTPKKAPFVTLLALARVREEVPDATLDLIGAGPLHDACVQMIRALDLDESVRLYGAADHEEVFGLLRTGRCFVQHSVQAPDGDSEGTPVAILEAMAMGLPVVSTRHAGIVDVVEEGGTGTLVDEYDLEGMAEGMLRYARDPELAAAHGRAGRDAACDRWPMEKTLARLRNVIVRAVRGDAISTEPVESPAGQTA